MSKTKIKVLLEDDNEILGNGCGHPVYRQYLPTKRYVELLNKYSIKGTFYIDIAHYLFLVENIDFEDFKFQSISIEETINLLVKNKMDVQIHLHSQWINARIINNKIYVSEKWNIGQLKENNQKELFEKAYKTLSHILSSTDGDFNLNSYKAGSWGIQPFNKIYDLFLSKGIKLLMGPIKGLVVDKLDINYEGMQSDFFPYYANKNDINKVCSESKIVVLPMTPTYLNWIDFIRYIFEIKIFNFFSNCKDLDYYDIPKKIKNLRPLSGKDKLRFGLKPFKTHLKINAQKFWYLKKTFKRSYNIIKNSEHSYKLLVIETHTKDFKNRFEDIDKFLSFLTKEYDDIEFVTSSSIVKDISSGVLKPLNATF